MRLIDNLGIKLTALFLALICWFFVFGEINKMLPEKNQEHRVLTSGRLITKQIPVQIVLEGEPSEGFKVERSKILFNPSFCLVVGEKDILENISYIRTLPINISGRSKSFNEVVKLEAFSKEAGQKDMTVEVIIPIEKAVKR